MVDAFQRHLVEGLLGELDTVSVDVLAVRQVRAQLAQRECHVKRPNGLLGLLAVVTHGALLLEELLEVVAEELSVL